MNNEHKPIHVLIIPAWMPSQGDPAAGVFIIDQAIALAESEDVRVGIIYQDRLPVPRKTEEHLQKHGVDVMLRKVMYIPKASRLLIGLWCRSYMRTFDTYVSLHGQPEILHAHSYVAGFAATYISRRTGIPFMLTEHSTNFLNASVAGYHASSVKDTLDKAQRILAVGASLRNALIQWTNTPIHILPNPVDTSVFRYNPDVIKKEMFTLISVGSLIPRKRIDLIIAALSKLKDVALSIIGSGNEESRLRLLAEKLGVEQRITWLSYVDPIDLVPNLQSAHVFISTSETETSGIAIVEAMLCGLPVICTKSGGPEEYVDSSQGVLLPADPSPDDVAEVVRGMRDSYVDYKPSHISERAKQMFSRDTIVPQLIQHYREVKMQNQ